MNPKQAADLVLVLDHLTFGCWPEWVRQVCQEHALTPDEVYDAFEVLYLEAEEAPPDREDFHFLPLGNDQDE